MIATAKTLLVMMLVMSAGIGFSFLAERAVEEAYPPPPPAQAMTEPQTALPMPAGPMSGPAGALSVAPDVANSEPSPAAADAATPTAMAAGSSVSNHAPKVADPAPTPFPIPTADDPQGALVDLVTFARSGKGRLAVGAGIVLLVWLLRRHLLRRIGWFNTRLGGYVSAFGTSALLYVSGALGASLPITLDIIADALATGFAASGQHEAARDAAGAAMRRRGAKLATVGALLAVLLLAGGCAAWRKSGAGPALIECGSANQGAIAKVGLELLPIVEGEKPDWSTAYDKAKVAGAVIGGCALVTLVQDYLSRRQAAPVGVTWEARAALERFRSEVAGGATWRTVSGDL